MSGATFNQLIESVQGNNGVFEARVSASWLQGRAAFGGLIAALAVEAMRQAPEATHPLRAIQVLFSSPVAEGSVNIETQVLRQGRSVTTMRADLSQQGQICCSVMASFGASRSSTLAVSASSRPEVGPPEALESFPFIAGVVPDFLQNFEVRWAKGG
ncbi:MAG TPA: thioesterase family protein, partial [Porticoccus sp.]|nr:thioesterase family protein [Porticoccus sp.]